MIFKTINSSVDDTRKTLALFNKDWNTYKTNWQNANGIGNKLGSIFTSSNSNVSVVSDENVQILRNWNNAVAHGCTNQETFNRIIADADDNTKMYFAGLNKGKGSIEGLKNAQNAAEVSTVGLTIAQTALNMAVTMGLTALISLAVKGYDELANSVDNCKERVDDLMSSYKSALDTANSNANRVEELADRYEDLSNGVDNLGENVSLTTEEYKEYNSIVNEIADMFPTLIQGHTDEGNAIINLKGNVEKLRDAYKEAKQEAYNLLIVSGKDLDGNDIIKQWEDTHDTGFWSKLFDLGADDAGKGISVTDALKQLKALQQMSAEQYREIERITNGGSREEILGLSDIEKEIGYGSYLYKALGLDSNVTNEEFAQIQKQAKSLIQTYNAEIESALSDVETLANAYLMTNEDYNKLDEQSKRAASMMVNSLNENIANKFSSKEDVGIYVNDIIQSISSNKDVQQTIIDLFTMDTTDMSIGEVRQNVNKYIDTIATEIDEDANDLKIRLGFDDSETEPLINKVKGFIKDEFDNKVGELTLIDLEKAANLEVSEGTLLSWDELIAKINSVENNKIGILSDNLGSLESYQSAVDSIINSYDALKTVQEEQTSQNYITKESYDALIEVNGEFAKCLEYGNGHMQINTEKANAMAKSNAELALAELEVKEALEVEQYNKNIKALDVLTSKTSILTQEELDQVQALKEENAQIEQNVQQYDLVENQIRQATSAYNEWQAAMNGPEEGDMYDSIVSSLSKVKELYDQGLTGTNAFKTATTALFGEDFNLDNFDTYFANIQRYFAEGSTGAKNFVDDLVKIGQLQIDADGNYFGDIDWDYVQKELNLTYDDVQALLGKLNDFNFEIDTTNGVDGIEDLTEAQNNLNSAIEDCKRIIEENKKLGLDTSKEEAELQSLETQLQSVNDELGTTISETTELSNTPIKFDIDAELGKLDLTNLSEEAQETLNQLNATKEQIKLNAQLGVDNTLLESEAQMQLNVLKEQLKVPVEVTDEDASQTIDGLTVSAENATTALETSKSAADNLANTRIGDLGFITTQNAISNANTSLDAFKTNLDNITSKNWTVTLSANGADGGSKPAELNGTTGGFAKLLGTAFANGSDITAKESSMSLTGELGRELVVRGNRWFTVGDNGAEFAYIKKGDIVFNAEQTKQLLNGSGKINSRGQALAQGTAYATNNSSIKGKFNGGASKSSSKSSSSKKKDKNEKKTKNLIDWIEKKISHLSRLTENWLNRAESATSAMTDTFYKFASKKMTSLLSTYGKAYDRYMKQANKVTFSKDSKKDAAYKKKIREGKIDITKVSDKKAEKISEYEQWYKKAIDSLDNFEETAERLANLPLDKAAKKIEKFNDAIDLLDAKLDNISVNDYKKANVNLDQQLAQQKNINSANQTALKTANSNVSSTAKALNKSGNLNSKSGITSAEKKKIQKAIKNGQEVDLSYFKEGSKGYKAAIKYNEAIKAQATAAQEAAMSMEELTAQIREVEKAKFDNIQTFYENQIKLLDLSQKKIEDRISLLEAKGMTVNAKYYEAEIEYQKGIRKEYKASQKELQAQLTQLENAGLRGTQEWYDCVEALSEVESAITECDTSIANMNNSITEVANTIQKKLLDSLHDVTEEMEWITSLMDKMDMFNEDSGAFTKEGLATLGSYVSGYNTSKYATQFSEGLVNEMQKALDNNQLEFTFNDQQYKFNSFEQLKDAIKSANETWRGQISETYEYSNKIIDMMVEKLKTELSALDKLITAKRESLQAEKD